MRLRVLTGRTHDAPVKKQKAITVIHSAVLMFFGYLWQPLCRESSVGLFVPFRVIRGSLFSPTLKSDPRITGNDTKQKKNHPDVSGY
jgi:hypothetical protein